MQRPRIGNLLTALSLLLSVAVLLVWARSLTVADWLSHSHATGVYGQYARRDFIVLSTYGFIGFTDVDMLPIDGPSAAWLQTLDSESSLGWSYGPVDRYRLNWKGFVLGLRRFGLSSGIDKYGHTNRVWKSFEIPYWTLLLFVSAPVQIALFQRVRSRRDKR